jgi:hypothetical protein
MPTRVNDITNPSYELNATGPIISYKRTTGKTATVPTRGSNVFTGKVDTWYGFTNVTGDTSTSTTLPDIKIQFPAVPAVPGARHWFSAWLLHGAPSTTTAKFQICISWRDINDVQISSPTTSRVAVPTSEFLRQAGGATAPTGTDHANGQIWLSGITDATVRSFRWDGVMFERNEALAVPAYGDGDQPGWVWNSTAHASASSLMTPGLADAQFLPFFTEG